MAFQIPLSLDNFGQFLLKASWLYRHLYWGILCLRVPLQPGGRTTAPTYSYYSQFLLLFIEQNNL